MVLPLDVKWTDIGNWKALWESSKKDIEVTLKKEKIITNASKNCYLRSENRLIVGIGISNLVIVETNDAILVADKDHSQKVKDIVKTLKERKIQEGQNHKKFIGHGVIIYLL